MLSLFVLLLPCTSLAAKYTSYSKLRCPLDSKSTLPTPTFGKRGGVFTVCTEQIIQAPIQKVYDALLDFKKYEQWNTFVVDVTLPENVTNTPRDVYVPMLMNFVTQGLVPTNTTSDERITFLSPPSALKKNGVIWAVWRGESPAAFELEAEHPSILNDAGNGYTRYLSYETYYKGAELLVPIRGTLSRQFIQQGVDLSDFVEGRPKGGVPAPV
ncbi:MAG: hypothetical protein M1831_003414 [Alyxoria varia]|nr:MAG: hypothetical protein M1831_003414 [Alyxoria varia]